MQNRIAELRNQLGLTQQALADEMAVSRQTIISLEKGKYNPSILLAHRIAARFGLTIEQVFIFEEGKWLFGGFCGRDSGIGPAQRAKTTIWN